MSLNLNKPIAWDRISRAVAYYTKMGFEYVEVPWIVNDKYVKLTYPKNCPKKHAFQTKLGTIVGSAEQSFIALTSEQRITKNQKYVAVTPCFRDHQPNDRLHQTSFMKVELFSTFPQFDASVLMGYAGDFFIKEGASLTIAETDIGLDWNVGGIEVGSYGTRKYKDLIWAYGTGLAEPRFSLALIRQTGNFSYHELRKSLHSRIEEINED